MRMSLSMLSTFTSPSRVRVPNMKGFDNLCELALIVTVRNALILRAIPTPTEVGKVLLGDFLIYELKVLVIGFWYQVVWDKFAMNITLEQGKTLKGVESDVLHRIEVVERACGMTILQMGEFVTNVSYGIDTYSMMEPLGDCAGIFPFTFHL
ncbi:hypothetical protein ACLB2K_026930 [Fragaria x ananassa]